MNIGDPSKNPLGWEWGFKKKKNHFNVGRIQTQIVREEDILQWPQCLKRANRR